MQVEGASEVGSVHGWGNPSTPRGIQRDGWGWTPTQQSDPTPNAAHGVPWEPPASPYDRDATSGTWGPPYPKSAPPIRDPHVERINEQPRRHPIVRPAPRPSTPRGLAPLDTYRCPTCQATFDGINTFPPFIARVNDQLRTFGSPELSHFEKSFIHRAWWGQHDCGETKYMAFYVDSVFRWRGD